MSCSQSALDVYRVPLCVQGKTSAQQRLCHHVAFSDLAASSFVGIQPAHARPSGHVVPGVNKASDEQREIAWSMHEFELCQGGTLKISKALRVVELRTCRGPRQTLAVQCPEVQVSEADVEAAQVQRDRQCEAVERSEL